MSPDVFVTGIGIVSPAGVGVEATWSSLLADGRAVDRLDGEVPVNSARRCAGQVRGFAPPVGTEDASRTVQLALGAAEEALRSARLLDERDLATGTFPVSVCIGTSKPLIDVGPFGSDAPGFAEDTSCEPLEQRVACLPAAHRAGR